MTGLGLIKSLNAGYGFIVSGGRTFFFHRSDVASDSAYDFDRLHEGDAVKFEVVDPEPDRGPRATQITWDGQT